MKKFTHKKYSQTEILEFLWKIVKEIKNNPEFTDTHKFAKEYAEDVVIMSIIAAFEQNDLRTFKERVIKQLKEGGIGTAGSDEGGERC